MTEMKNNIRQHPNGTWEGRYYDVDGKQHSLYGRTKAIVKDKLASKRAEIVSGNSITETDLNLMMRFDFFTGLRESELIGLTWDCVDFEKHTLRIYRQFVRIASGPDKGKMMYTPLKNALSP